jgi:hypothetical protein
MIVASDGRLQPIFVGADAQAKRPPLRFFLNSITSISMSYPVKLRVIGVVVDRPSTTVTRGGTPRAAFNVLVRGTVTTRRHHVVAYGTVATFCDRYVLPGQRLHVEGTSLPKQRYPRELAFPAAYEAVILAQSVREVHQKARAKAAPNPVLAAAATREATPTADPASVTSPLAAPLALAV